MHIEKQAKVMINANGVGVKFNMGRKGETLKSLVLNPRISFGEFWALKDVSFKGLSGDVIGIIGPNGAGKTTLCRVIANLLKTDTGKIDVYGE
ncbi:MAG TPA: ATP-binding cassette domain-containing protein, partial [Bacillota bacterium]|nr:ATP-binding cassette domain-containing protein [Bacillota bacterium]